MLVVLQPGVRRPRALIGTAGTPDGASAKLASLTGNESKSSMSMRLSEIVETSRRWSVV